MTTVVNYADSLRAQASAYYDAIVELKKCAEITKATEARIERATRQIAIVEPDLHKSVQPQCGSAHMPSRRMFQFNSDPRVVVVEWDDKYHRPRISIQALVT